MTANKTKTSLSVKIKMIAYWICTILIALETAAGAQWDLSRNEFVRGIFNHLGYPVYLLTIIGIWKIPAFIAILVPRMLLIKEWAYAGLFFVYSGAFASHLAVGDVPAAWIGPLVFMMLTAGSWYLRPASRKLANK
ncbi:hypothetical protein A3860_16495 [Niastella vici]|uniref:DoxX-like family protein n=2 Tax=Niastella vici TaxID=1703345 RepID=A0A1V9G4X5_9BACT|nr:hypothetical protein A3860_16495 [Niastella vici]